MAEETRVAWSPAGLWLRSRAFALDYVPIATYLAVLVAIGVFVSRSAQPLTRALFGSPLAGQAVGFLLITLPVSLYFVLAEASPWQATWGKRKMGLVVSDREGRRIGLARSIGRTALKFSPWELAHACIWQISFAADRSSLVYTLGFSLVWLAIGANVVSLLLSPLRQTIYDRLAGTVVARSSHAAQRAAAST